MYSGFLDVIMKILITGGTGFLGQYLVRNLAREGHTQTLLGRTKSDLFSDLAQCEFFRVDLSDPQAHLALEDCLFSADVIIHLAALYDIRAGYDKAFMHNVVGTQNALKIAKRCKNLKAFYAISTIAVGDETSFYLGEDELPLRKSFGDAYSQTKYLAEKLVRESSGDFPVRILRPGIIVGDSQSGFMPKADGPYYFMDAFKKYLPLVKAMKVLPLPYNPSTKIPLIPVDHCASAIAALVNRDDYSPETKGYHLISEDVPTVAEFLSDMAFKLDLKTEFIPVKENPLHHHLLKWMGVPTELVRFMFSRLSYDKTRTNVELPELQESRYSEYKKNLFSYLD